MSGYLISLIFSNSLLLIFFEAFRIAQDNCFFKQICLNRSIYFLMSLFLIFKKTTTLNYQKINSLRETLDKLFDIIKGFLAL